MTLTLQPVRVATGSDEEGLLVFDRELRLAAVLTHLGEQYDGLSGHWYLEAGFGRLDRPDHPTSLIWKKPRRGLVGIWQTNDKRLSA